MSQVRRSGLELPWHPYQVLSWVGTLAEIGINLSIVQAAYTGAEQVVSI